MEKESNKERCWFHVNFVPHDHCRQFMETTNVQGNENKMPHV
jgi:hypothetical protein